MDTAMASNLKDALGRASAVGLVVFLTALRVLFRLTGWGRSNKK